MILFIFFFSSRRRHTRSKRDWSSDVCSSDLVYVDTPEDFNAWVRGQQEPAKRDEKEAAGRHVFETNACLNCHAIIGTNGTGRFGPDLTHLMSRRTIASGAAENNSQNLRLWIQNPD